MSKRKPVFDYEPCMACGICGQACPFSCIEMNKTDIDALKKAYPVLFYEMKCTGCGLCQKACPVEAILMKESIIVIEAG